ncbi:MAG: hypothetical protein IJT01_13940, partial [Selenomonadaceae bacterium]|nr:hypothetical protein [Selenomonadaceae bacterium]
MSRKQRVLTGLRAIESGLQQVEKTGSKEELAAVAKKLTVTRDLCRQGLLESGYAKYGEIYDGLILATQQMTGSKDPEFEKDAIALCEELLRHLAAETEKEKKFKKDIVFLPYKASMWDSLESVWKAAEEDKEHCNAYVVPIPYADLTPDRGVAEWHCERADF